MTATIKGTITTGSIYGGIPAERRFSVDAQAIEVIDVPGTTSSAVVFDANVQTDVNATAHNDYQLSPVPSVPGGDIGDVSFAALDAANATVDSTGRTTRVSDGDAQFLVTGSAKWNQKTTLNHTQTGGATVKTLLNYVAGSLAKAASDAIDNALAGKSAADIPIFSAKDHAAGVYVRSTSCWAAGFDLTGVPVWNDWHGEQFLGALVASDVLLYAEHVGVDIPLGTKFRFVDAANVMYERIVAAKANVGPSNASDGYATDWTVLRLDSSLPASIKFYSVTPANTTPDRLHEINMGVPTIGIRQGSRATVRELWLLGAYARYRKSQGSQRSQFYDQNLVVGDSSCPSLLCDGTDVYLPNLWTHGGAGSGPFIGGHISDINTAMAAAGSINTLTQANLSAFTNYGVKRIPIAAAITGTLADFPLYVKPSAITGLGALTLAQAQSARFYQDAAKTLELPREVVSADEIHVKHPSLQTGESIYIAYDGVLSDYAATDTYGRNNVWTNNYAAVFHMEQGSVADSTDNGNNGTNHGTTTASGQMGEALSFDGVDDYVGNIALGGLPDPAPNVTVSLWANVLAKDTDSILQAFPDNNNNRFNLHFPWGSTIYWDYGDISGGGGRLSTAFNATWDNVMAHWAFVAGNGVGQSIYRNGALIASDGTAGSYSKGAGTLNLGTFSNSEFWNGIMDELRISSVARSASWISAEHANQSSVTTFFGTAA